MSKKKKNTQGREEGFRKRKFVDTNPNKYLRIHNVVYEFPHREMNLIKKALDFKNGGWTEENVMAFYLARSLRRNYVLDPNYQRELERRGYKLVDGKDEIIENAPYLIRDWVEEKLNS